MNGKPWAVNNALRFEHERRIDESLLCPTIADSSLICSFKADISLFYSLKADTFAFKVDNSSICAFRAAISLCCFRTSFRSMARLRICEKKA